MTGEDSGRLAYLVKEVRAARSPAARLRIAARTWRILRRLSPEERARFAAELGLHGAAETLDRLAAGPAHEMAAELSALADRAEKADPGQVGGLLTQLRDPAKRHQLVEQGLHTLADQVAALLGGNAPPVASGAAGETGEELGRDEAAPARRGADAGFRTPAAGRPAEPDEPASWERDDDRPARPQEGFRTAEAALRSTSEPGWEEWVSRTTQSAAAGAVAGAALAGEPAGVSSSPHPEALGVAAPEPPRPAATPPPGIAPPPSPTPLPAMASGPAGSAGAPPGPEAPAPSPSLPSSPFSEPAHASPALVGLTARFRALRHRLATPPAPADDLLVGLLAAFPPGWARRRAVTAALRAGLPRALDQAAALVLALPSPTDRRWCWSALLEGRTLTPADRQRLAAAEPSPRVRRRLAS